MAEDNDIDVSNTIIVKAIKRGMSLEDAEDMAEEIAEEEAKTIIGQTVIWFRHKWKSILAWLSVVGTILGAASIAWLQNFFNVQELIK